MILVDSTVVIDYLKNADNPKVALYRKINASGAKYGIAPFTVTEVLQGARNEKEYKEAKSYLDGLEVFYLPETKESYEKAARVYYNLRRRGVTPRNIIDIYIALIAADNGFPLLHNDRDFEVLVYEIKELRLL